MLRLDDPAWSQLRHAYGSGSDIPGWIREVESRLEGKQSVDDLLIEIWDNLCHQWSTYDGTYAAVPHFVQLCTNVSPPDDIRIRLLEMIGMVRCLFTTQSHNRERRTYRLV